jgi:hypothetical protein
MLLKLASGFGRSDRVLLLLEAVQVLQELHLPRQQGARCLRQEDLGPILQNISTGNFLGKFSSLMFWTRGQFKHPMTAVKTAEGGRWMVVSNLIVHQHQ